MIYRFERLLKVVFSLSLYQNAAAAADAFDSSLLCDFKHFLSSFSLSFCSIIFFTLMKIRIDRYNLSSRCVFCALHLIGFPLSALREFNDRSMYIFVYLLYLLYVSQCVCVYFIINRLAMSCLEKKNSSLVWLFPDSYNVFSLATSFFFKSMNRNCILA